MCVVSNIGDHYRGRDHWPWRETDPYQRPYPPSTPKDFAEEWKKITEPSKLDSLAERVKKLEELIRRGKEYDEKTGQPDCETDEKWKQLRELAKELGVEIKT
jgi:hypothetical protein